MVILLLPYILIALKRGFYLFLIVLLFSACSWFKPVPEIGVVLSKHFKNSIFKQFDTAAYNKVFLKAFEQHSKNFKNPIVMKAWYAERGNAPQLVTRFFVSGGLDSLKNYIRQLPEHGLDSKAFDEVKLEKAINALKTQKFKEINAAYPVIAELELVVSNALINYTNAMNFGSVNPRNILSRFYIKVKRPDSLYLTGVLNTPNIGKLLEDVQPASAAYKALQGEFAKPSNKVIREKLIVNLERLRWKLPEIGKEYVFVNVPDFSLTWFNGKDTLSHMKVCVGGKREEGYEEKYAAYLKSKNLDDKPSNHETPMLVSTFNSIQVNPVWNIPVSIAQSEIYYQAIKDPYYLSNSNIKVYNKGKLVGDPDTIQWNNYKRDKLPFRFVQGSGGGNALGKFKFIFENSSSIYLHDTNYKGGFNLRNRAISHGCIRIERPLEFAEHLVGNKNGYDQLRMEVNLPPLDTTKMAKYKKIVEKRNDTLNRFVLQPKWFGVKKGVSVVINYFTAWVENGKMELRDDVYNQDPQLWEGMKMYTATKK